MPDQHRGELRVFCRILVRHSHHHAYVVGTTSGCEKVRARTSLQGATFCPNHNSLACRTRYRPKVAVRRVNSTIVWRDSAKTDAVRRVNSLVVWRDLRPKVAVRRVNSTIVWRDLAKADAVRRVNSTIVWPDLRRKRMISERPCHLGSTSALPRLRPGRGRVWERVWPPKRGPFWRKVTYNNPRIWRLTVPPGE